ncbi:MAG: DUF1697 domain-containing protein [Longimicrobiales bacterium]
MTGRVAVFLRGLNVGGHRVKMDRLRAILADLGCDDPRTLQAAGNVVLDDPPGDPAAVVRRIEAGLEEALGYPVPAFLRTMAELEGVLHEAPVEPGELDGPDHAHYVLLLTDPVDAEVRARFDPLDSAQDSFRYGPREVHWVSRGKMSESPLFGSAFDRATRGLRHTMRNATTLRRIVERFGG